MTDLSLFDNTNLVINITSIKTDSKQIEDIVLEQKRVSKEVAISKMNSTPH